MNNTWFTITLIALAAAFVGLFTWGFRRIPTLDCPRCHSLNTSDVKSPIGMRVICNDCGYEWGDSE